VARTSVRPTTAAAIGRPRASRNRSTHRPVTSASAVSHEQRRGDDEALARFWEHLVGRLSGPRTFRLLLQPAMSTLFAVRGGSVSETVARRGRIVEIEEYRMVGSPASGSGIVTGPASRSKTESEYSVSRWGRTMSASTG
jgi:hypothetical protein